MIAFWLSFHSLGFCMCESVWRKTFACLYVYWWVCERGTEGVCSSVCANEPLIFLICPSVCICLMNQISQLDVSRLSALVCSYLCSCACEHVLVHVWVCICSVHVSVDLSREERSQKVWWATQVGFSEVIIFAWLTIDCHAPAPNAASNTDITPPPPPTHTHTHILSFSHHPFSLVTKNRLLNTHTHTPHTHTHTHSHTSFPSLIIPFLRSQRTGCWTHTHTHTHTCFLPQLDCSRKEKRKNEVTGGCSNDQGLETPRSSHHTPCCFWKQAERPSHLNLLSQQDVHDIRLELNYIKVDSNNYSVFNMKSIWNQNGFFYGILQCLL